MLEHTRLLSPEALPLGGILGRVLSEDVTASEPLPPYPASIKVPLPTCPQIGVPPPAPQQTLL